MRKNLYHLVVCLQVFCFLQAVQANPECTSNSTIINEYLYHQDPSNQGSLGVCYAHSAANIYGSIYQQTHGEFVLPSPLMLSIYSGVKGYKTSPFKVASFSKKVFYLSPIIGWQTYFYDKFYGRKKGLVDRITGGYFGETFTDAASIQPCTMESIDWFIHLQTQSLDEEQSLELFYEYISYLGHTKSSYGKRSKLDENAMITHMEAKGFYINAEIKERFAAINHYIEMHGFTRNNLTGQVFVKKTFADFLLRRCYEFNSGRKFGKLKFKIESYFAFLTGRRNLIAKLDKHFSNSQSLPVEIAYCFGHLTDQEDCGYHSSVIYGKSCVQDKLYFLVRNSWGGKSLRDRYVKPGSQHSRNGDYWMSIDDLKKSWTKGKGELNFVRNLKAN